MESFRSPHAPRPKRPYSSGIRVGPWCHLSGHVPTDHDGRCQGRTAAEQAAVILTNLENTLSGTGGTRRDIVSTSVFLTDISDIDEIDAVYREFFAGQTLPARTTVQISALGKPEFRVEISAVAYRSNTGPGTE